MNCKHEQFESDVKVARIQKEEGGEITDYMVEIKVRCSNCKEFLEFKGVSGGLNFSFPTASPDNQELRLPAKLNKDLTIKCN